MTWKTALLISTFVMAGAPTATSQISNDVVRIGVMEDMSGLYADLGGAGSVVAARMAVKDFGGTVAGKPIEIVQADHQNKPDIGSAIARKWFEVDGVDTIVGIPTSSVALAVQEISRQFKKPFLTTASTTDLTGKACSPYSTQWEDDTYVLANVSARAIAKGGGDSWFFITADYTFGHSLEQNTTEILKELGATVVGSVRHPINTVDFSSPLLKAQASKAKIIALANAGGDTVTAVKQAAEFGISRSGQQIAGLLIFITDVDSMGLSLAQGLLLATSFYWDLDDSTRDFAQRFKQENNGRVPTKKQAATYSAVLHYLKAVEAAQTDTGDAVAAKIRSIAVNDFMSKDLLVRQDGRVIRPVFLAQVKSPAESKGRWDYYKILNRVNGTEANRPLERGACQLPSNQ